MREEESGCEVDEGREEGVEGREEMGEKGGGWGVRAVPVQPPD